MGNWTLTDEHKSQIPEWNERWKRIILQTGEVDIERVRPHIEAQYRAAGLPVVPVIHVKSPMMGAIVWAAASVFWREGTDSTRRAIYDATYGTTVDATDAATYAAARRAARHVNAATSAATNDATVDAIDAATNAKITHATNVATDGATNTRATNNTTHAATYAATNNATRRATIAADKSMLDAAISVVGEHLRDQVLKTLDSWFDPYRGGSEWASWCSYLSFVRDVVGWSHESHKNYYHYEQAAIYGGPQFFHERFCLVSDFATHRLLDENGKLHAEHVPAIRWGCGTEAWYRHGEKIDPKPWQANTPNDLEDALVRADWLEERSEYDQAKEMQLIGGVK